MDRRALAVWVAALALCLYLIARFFASGHDVCVGLAPLPAPTVTSLSVPEDPLFAGTVNPTPKPTPQVSYVTDYVCRTADLTLGFEIGATLLAALAGWLWVTKRST